MKKTFFSVAILSAAIQISAALTSTELTTLHNMLVKFYGYQRAGLKTGSANNLNTNFTNAWHTGDQFDASHPLDGGWYDAGDFCKFGMNLSYSVYCLLKGYDVFPTGYDDKYGFDHSNTPNNIPDILDEVKFATDYMMKAVISESQVVLDVGNGETDHGAGFTIPTGPSRSTVNKDIFMCDGADIPATYAACLALMSNVYKQYDATYAASCLAKAKTAFAFAKSKYAAGKPYCTPQGTFYQYPLVNNVQTKPAETERKIAAGVELYRVSDASDPNYATYKAWAQSNVPDFSDCAGYAFVAPLASFEVWRQGLGGATALLTNSGFIQGRIKTSGRFKNVYQNGGWGTASDVGTAAFEMALNYVISSNTTERATLKTRIENHIDWVVGKGASNTQSFVCGFNSGPTQIHYRVTSYKPIPGAVVAGPDGDGNWVDVGTKYQNTEVAINYNAGHVGAIAFLRAINGVPSDPSGPVDIKTPFTANPETNIDFSKQTVKFTSEFSRSVAWTIKINGANGSKTYKGTGASVNQVWDGSADVGSILAGEHAYASISLDTAKISIIDQAYASPIDMTIIKSNKETPKASDVLISNFDNTDSSTAQGGVWRAIGTSTGLYQTSISFPKDSGSVACLVSGSVKTIDHKNFTGVKATFNKAGSATNIEQAKSVLFDLRSTKTDLIKVYVELEQSDITENAYFGVSVPVTAYSNRYRVNIADFKQPDWKTSAKTLDLSKITAVRFAVYDSIGSVNLYLDNVYIGYGQQPHVTTAMKNFHNGFNRIISNSSIYYSVPQSVKGTFSIRVFDMSGKNVMARSFADCAGKNIALPFENLPSGMYTVVNSVNGKPIGENFALYHTK